MRFSSDSQRRAVFANLPKGQKPLFDKVKLETPEWVKDYTENKKPMVIQSKISDEMTVPINRGFGGLDYKTRRIAINDYIKGHPELKTHPHVAVDNITLVNVLMDYAEDNGVAALDNIDWDEVQSGGSYKELRTSMGLATKRKFEQARLGDNDFSLYAEYDPKEKDYWVKSDEYPEVKFLIQGFGMKPDKVLGYLEDVPDEDFVGLKRVDVFTPQKFRKYFPGSRETSGYIDKQVAAETEWAPMINLNVKGGKKQAVHDAMHEVGHHLDLEDEPRPKKWDLLRNIVYDLKSDSYAKLLNPDDKLGRVSPWAEERAEELRGLSEAKAITFDEAMRYAGVGDEI